MALEIYAVETKTGNLLAQLPGTPSGPLAREASGFSSASFTISVDDPAMPAAWGTLMEAHRCSLLAVDDREGVRTPVWLGLINQAVHTDSGLDVQCASTEWLLDTRRASDAVWGATTDIMKIVRDLHAQFEAGGAGVGLAVDAPDAGVKRAWSVKRSDGKSFMACLEELGLEWAIDLTLTSTKVVKTLRVRAFDPAATLAPATVVQVPAHTSSWRFTESRLEADAATVVYVEGDGTGDTKTVSTPVIDTAREAAGYPRVEAWESVSGVTNAAEAGKLAEQFAARRFLDRQAVEITVRNSADGIPLSGLRIGDSIRVVIDTPRLQHTATYRLASWEVEPSGDSWTPVLAPAGLSLYGWRRPTAKAAALKVRDLGKDKNRDPIGSKYISPIANSSGDRLTFDSEKGAGWTAPDGSFKPYGNGDGSSGIPGGNQPGWGDGTDSSWSGAPAASIKAVSASKEVYSTSLGYGHCSDELGNFFAIISAAPVDDFIGRSIGTAVPDLPERLGWVMYGGRFEGGHIEGYGPRGAAVMSAAFQASLIDINPGWETLALQGYVGSGFSASVSLAIGTTSRGGFATGGYFYAPFFTHVSLDSVSHSQRGLVRWALDDAGNLMAGDPEIVMGSLGSEKWPPHLVRVSTELAFASGDGRAFAVGLSPRGVEKTWSFPPLHLGTSSWPTAVILPAEDGSGQRLAAFDGWEIPLDDRARPTAAEWGQTGPYKLSDSSGHGALWASAKGRAVLLGISSAAAGSEVVLSTWTGTGPALSTAAPFTGPASIDRYGATFSHEGWLYTVLEGAVASAQIIENN